jgi:ankyrin repeat protein
VARQLLARANARAELEARDVEGRTALFQAASIVGSAEVIEMLVAAGADVNARNGIGSTPVWACINNRNNWFADPAGFTNSGVVCPKARALDALLRHGGDPNACGRTETPPLFQALMFEADNDQPEFPEWSAVALLLKCGLSLLALFYMCAIP